MLIGGIVPMRRVIALIAISALAAYFLRGTRLFILAVVNAGLNFWSLGILWNYRGAPPSGIYEGIVSSISFLTSVLGLILLIAAFLMR